MLAAHGVSHAAGVEDLDDVAVGRLVDLDPVQHVEPRISRPEHAARAERVVEHVPSVVAVVVIQPVAVSVGVSASVGQPDDAPHEAHDSLGREELSEVLLTCGVQTSEAADRIDLVKPDDAAQYDELLGPDAYQDLLLNRITRIEGVTGVHTSFVLRRALDKAPMPA